MIKYFSDFRYVDPFLRYLQSNSKVVKNGAEFSTFFTLPNFVGGTPCKISDFGGSGHILTKFYQRMWLIAGVIKWTLIRPPGTLVPKAFCFSRDVFNQTQDLRAPSADRRETLHSDQHMRQLFNASPKIKGVLP